jgi:preprotein translocase subunit SecD
MVNIARWKIILVLIISALGILYSAPNLVSQKILNDVPDWLPHKHMNLGLDLRGGAHLLIEAKIDTAIKEGLESLRRSARVALRRKPSIGYTGLRNIRNGTTVTILKEDQVTEARSRLRQIAEGMELQADGPRLTLQFTDQLLRDRQAAIIEQVMTVLRKRVDETGLKEASLQRQGADRILLQVPGIDDTKELKAIIGETAKMTFHLLDPEFSTMNKDQRVRPGVQLMPEYREVGDPNPAPLIYYLVRKRVEVSGENLVDAQPTVDQNNRPVVSFRFDPVGGRKFGNVTRRNVKKPFAIVLDGKVISAPVIQEPILGGNGQISGNFTVDSSRKLAILLRSGALPVPLTFIEERTVGPGLGADSIQAGKIASLFALAAVIVFMAFAYGCFGLMANVALALNLVLLAAALSVLQATLTLPGIAGIVLTIGMAVDANVLVFERIREEARAGRTPISAVDAGYKRAFTTIIDANLTTFIAALLLYMFGSGPVRGFAVTLAIGLMTSMFSAIMVTRIMVVAWLLKKRPQSLPL